MPRKNSQPNIWKDVLSNIKREVPSHQFDTWFQHVEPGPCDESTIELKVPNSFSRECIRKRFGDMIVGAAAEQMGGTRPSLRLTLIPTDHANGTGQDQPGTVLADLPTGLSVDSITPSYANGSDNGRTYRQAPAAPAHREPGSGDFLNPAYRFETFVAGPGNRMPRAALQEVILHKQRVYNPLFIHGPVGLGKTHLAQAVAHEWRGEKPESTVVYASCEQFINSFIQAVDGGDLTAFRRRYRNVDLLIIDDVQFLTGKERSQEEFFHTFNAVHQRGGQIVLTADQPPHLISGLTERLMSRFRWGMVCELESPGFGTRLDIVRQKADLGGSNLPEEVAQFIAENIRSNVRELEGAVTRVIGHAFLTGQELTLVGARHALSDMVAERQRRVTIDHIAQVVTRHFGVKLSELQSRRRTKAIALPRQVCMALARRHTRHSLEEIGGFFGGRDHSTVLYGVDRIEERCTEDTSFREVVEQLGQRAQSWS